MVNMALREGFIGGELGQHIGIAMRCLRRVSDLGWEWVAGKELCTRECREGNKKKKIPELYQTSAG